MKHEVASRRALRTSSSGILGAVALVLSAAPPIAAAGPAAPWQAQSAAETKDGEERPEDEFEGLVFRSHFAVNLHHFLYLQGIAARNSGRVGEAPEAWMRAVEFYRSTMIERDLLFDPGMRRIDELLGRTRTLDELPKLELPPGLAAVLMEAAPLYQQRFWPEHDARNNQWLLTVQPLLAEYGPAVADRLCRLFVANWPERVTVDVLVYANWAGAYTSSDPGHIRIATRFPEVEEPHEAFETVMHETSHLLIDQVASAIHRIAVRDGAAPPRDLWHCVLFFTVGEVVRESEVTPEDYVPYAVRHGLWERVPAWAKAYSALQEHWTPYLRGEVEMDEALTRVLAEFPADSAPVEPDSDDSEEP